MVQLILCITTVDEIWLHQWHVTQDNFMKENKPKVHEQYTIIFLDLGPLFGVRDTFSYPSFFFTPLPSLCSADFSFEAKTIKPDIILTKPIFSQAYMKWLYHIMR